MKLRKFALLVVSMTLASIAFAGHGEKHEMMIVVEDDSDGDTTRVELSGEDLGFRLHEMQVGESRAVVDSQGRNILITRQDDGYEFDVDGKKISMPSFHGGPHREHVVMMHPEDGGSRHGPHGITIISGEPVDETTREKIESLLEAAGHTSGVRFIDHRAAKDGRQRIKIVEKRVEKGTE